MAGQPLPVRTEDPCEFCGSVQCRIASAVKCRHTGKHRATAPAGGPAPVSEPVTSAAPPASSDGDASAAATDVPDRDPRAGGTDDASDTPPVEKAKPKRKTPAKKSS